MAINIINYDLLHIYNDFMAKQTKINVSHSLTCNKYSILPQHNQIFLHIQHQISKTSKNNEKYNNKKN